MAAAKACHGSHRGIPRDIDGTAVCFVKYCSMLTRMFWVRLYFCCRRDRSEKTVIVLWTLVCVAAPHTHRTARPKHMASIDSLRIIVERTEHTRGRSNNTPGSPSVVCYLFQPTSRIDAVSLLVFVSFEYLYFHFRAISLLR